MYKLNKSKEESYFLEGPAGKLEALVAGIGKTTQSEKNIGIVCHPHPLYQGTMHNKVVTTVIRVWQELGFSTVRFNFRGVGKSEGRYGEGVGEVEDLQAVFKWAQEKASHAKIWLAGFSFGAFIATQFAAQNSIAGLITIAPALSLFDFVSLKAPNCPWLIIHGEQDELVSAKKVKEWYQLLIAQNTQEMPMELITLEQASHFFHGYLNELKTIVEEFTVRVGNSI